MPTGVVDINSALHRKSWLREGLLQAKKQSFWSPLTGSSARSVVYQKNTENGLLCTFDFDGYISGRAIRGKEQLYGTGEAKKKFSSNLTVDRYRFAVDNGDRFDAKSIESLDLNNHAHSRTLLADKYIRNKDQAFFDSGQGLLGQAPSHIIDLGTTFDFNTLNDISNTLKTSQGFSTGARRAPLEPYILGSGEPVWLFVIDSPMCTLLKNSPGFQAVVQQADVRGSGNMLLKGVIGRIGNLLITEAPSAFGTTTGTTAGWGLDSFSAEIAGMRQYSGATPAAAIWTGQAGFNPNAANLHSRGLLVGAGAFQFGMAKQPDYTLQYSNDHSITSESGLEVWQNIQKTIVITEDTDYNDAKISGIDYGVVAVDVQVN